MKPVVPFLAFAACLLLLAPFSYADAQYQYSATPNWVEVRSLNTSIDVPEDTISDGVFYRIVDDQIKINTEGTRNHYLRFAQTVANPKGLNDSSQIEINFDPNYESLLIHDISVYRNGKQLDRYETADISVFYSESEVEQRIYNGKVTFSAILKDVIVGDTVDYSYTIIGANPVYKGLFSTSRTLVWGVPVQDQYHRVLWGKPTPVFVEQRNGSFPISEREIGSYREYSIHVNSAQPNRFSGQSPAWHLPNPTIYYSETQTWKDVNNWALKLYADLGLNMEVKRVAETISQQSADPKQQLVLALAFVQQNIRYVGVQLGENSHLPTPASETLAQKYGDCKDKTVLLLAIIKELGLTGYPALVETDIGQSLTQIQPSISRFDHVLVNAVVDGVNYWLDPTMSNQVGPLENLYQPDFGYALVVKPGEDSLTDMNASEVSEIQIEENYTIPEKVEDPATFIVKTNYLGLEAQRILSRVQNDGKESVRKDYLEYYQRSFPETNSTAPLEIAIDESTGNVSLTELYEISSIFTEAQEGYEIDFYASDIRNELAEPEVINRNTPFALNHPKNITNRFNLAFEEDGWTFDNESFAEESAYFSYTASVKFENNLLTLEYVYESKQDFVPHDEIKDYLDARDRVLNNSSYGILKYKKNNDASTKEPGIDAQASDKEPEPLDDETTYLIWYLLAAVIFFCLMLIDWRLFTSSRQDGESMLFQPVSLTKFYVLSFITFGLYCSYWMYRNWLLLEKKEKTGRWPIARGIFSLFWLYPLYEKLAEYRPNTADGKPLFSKKVAGLLALSYFALSIATNLVDNITLLLSTTVLIPLTFLPFIHHINSLNSREHEDYITGSKVGFRHVLIGLVFIPIIAICVTGVTYLTPRSHVIEGSKLWFHDKKFMQRKRVVSASENIQYFYSDALLSIRYDGNGFTEQRVFSYWRDEENVFTSAFATYDAIKDIKVEYAKNDDENTVVTVVRKDNTDFLLFVSPISSKDRIFTKALLDNWNANKVANQ
ncbi:MAG: DUF3857 domain-containing protein [Aestuariibacter sp.]